MAMKAREFDAGFQCLGTRVAKEGLVHAGQRGQFLCQLLLGRNMIEIAAMQQFTGLFAQRFGDSRMGVAETGYADAGKGVEIAFALLINEPASFATGKS